MLDSRFLPSAIMPNIVQGNLCAVYTCRSVLTQDARAPQAKGLMRNKGKYLQPEQEEHEAGRHCALPLHWLHM